MNSNYPILFCKYKLNIGLTGGNTNFLKHEFSWYKNNLLSKQFWI